MTLWIGKKIIACHNVCLGDKDSRISVQITKQMPCDKYLLMQNWYYTISCVLLMWWIRWITLGHLFLSCQVLGSEVIKWLVDHKFKIENLSGKDILFDIIGCGEEIFVNRILLLAKQYLYSCRQNEYSPSIRVLNSKINTVFLIETMIAKSTNKLETHNMKWSRFFHSLVNREESTGASFFLSFFLSFISVWNSVWVCDIWMLSFLFFFFVFFLRVHKGQRLKKCNT